MKKYIGAILGLIFILASFLNPIINKRTILYYKIAVSYSVFLEDVRDLTWCSIQYEKRKLAPLPIEDVVRIFDFRKDGIQSVLNHSVISKDFTEYLGKNTKSVPVQISYTKATNSWAIYQKDIENYNSFVKKSNTRKTFWYSHGFMVKFLDELKIPEIYVNPVDKP